MASEAVSHLDDASNKRKRGPEDHGDREQKKVHIEDSRLGIDDLHLDVGEKYLLCRTRKTPLFIKNLPLALPVFVTRHILSQVVCTSFTEVFG